MAAFGNKDTTLKRLRTGNHNASDVSGGAVLTGVLPPLAGISTIICEGSIAHVIYDPKTARLIVTGA